MTARLHLMSLLASAWVGAACATMAAAPAAEPIRYAGPNLIFPAVYQAVQIVLPGGRFTSVDIEKQRFHLNGLEFADGLARRRMDLEISSWNGSIDYEVAHEQQFDQGRLLWVSNGIYLFKSPKQIQAALNEVIQGVLVNDDAYQAARQAALSDLAFVHRVLEPVGDGVLGDFVTRLVSPTQVELSVSVRSVKESPAPASGSSYRYEVDCMPGPEEGLGGLLDNDQVLYESNDPLVAQYRPGAEVHLRAKIVEAHRVAGNGFALKLDALAP